MAYTEHGGNAVEALLDVILPGVFGVGRQLICLLTVNLCEGPGIH